MKHRNSFLLPLVLSLLLHFLLIFTWRVEPPTVASSVKVVPVSYLSSPKGGDEILRPFGPQDDEKEGLRMRRILKMKKKRSFVLRTQDNRTARPFPSEMDLLLQSNNRLPDYPYAALQMKLEGIVLVQLDLSAEGKVLQATIARSSGYEILDQAACEALQMWKFQPETTTPLLQKVVFNLGGAFSTAPDQNNIRKEAE